MINIKNDDNKCFLWCHIRHLNPLKAHPEEITKVGRQIISSLDCCDIKFPASKKYYGRLEKSNNICINVFAYENVLTYPIHVSGEQFEDCMNLLLIKDENKSFICRILIHLYAIGQNLKIRNTFADIV